MRNKIIHLNFGTGDIHEFHTIHRAIQVSMQYIAMGFEPRVVKCSNANDGDYLENYFQGLLTSYQPKEG
tara:strand:+ start:1214 stop:1420 length:207 start_codon:yes stop_codon:yes gene_type:complete